MASRATSKLRLEVLGGYRRLMKLRKRVFAGDDFAIRASRVQLRQEFLKNKDITNVQEIEGLVQGIMDVEDMLSTNIVQGKMNKSGHYEVTIDSHTHLNQKSEDEFSPNMITHVDDRLTGQTVVVERTCGGDKRHPTGKADTTSSSPKK